VRLHPTLATLFHAWAGQGVRWCALRLPEDLEAPRGDLDLLLAPESLPEAKRLALQLGFAELPGYHRGTHLLAYDRRAECWLWLHLVTELAFGPFGAVRPGGEAEALARVTHQSVLRLAPDDELWIGLLHALLDREGVPAGRRERLAGLADRASASGVFPAALANLLPAEWSPARVLEAVRQRSWSELERLAPLTKREAARRGRPPLVRRVLRRTRRVVREMRDARRQRGVSVALLGPDGAGKSTLAAGLIRSSVFPVRQVYMGLTGGMLRHVDRLRVPGVVRAGRLLVIWGRYLRAQYHQARGRMVVFDRYIYDAEVPPPYRLGPFGRVARWMDGRSCPAPDLVLVLDAPGAVMHGRKGEYNAETLEHWRQRFLALQHRVPRLEVIDTTQGPDAVRSDALERIWRHYVARWGGR
jgi:thymidylate kinase